MQPAVNAMGNVRDGGTLTKATPSWRLRVAVGLSIATLVGVISLVTTATAVDAAGPDQIVVQASGATGEEEMLLSVNGVETARWRVAKGRQAYEHVVSGTLEVKTVEVAFINDNGPRDLTVNRIDLGGVVLQSTAPGTTSSGTYEKGDGGCRERASVSAKLHCNGSFTFDVPAGVVLSRVADGPVVNVRARGRSGGEELQIRINDKVVASSTLGKKWQIVSANLPVGTAVTKAEVQFVNDGRRRDLRVDYLEIDGRRFESESSETIALGTYSSAAGGCSERPSSSEWLHCSGWFRYNVSDPTVVQEEAVVEEPLVEEAIVVEEPVAPTLTTTVAPPTTTTTTTTPTTAAPVDGDELAIRALGRSGSEIMQLRVNGNVVDSWTVGKSLSTYRASVADADDVTKVEVQFVNDARGRDLRVDYMELDGERYQSESNETRSKGSYSSSQGCSERNSSSEWLHCAGWFSYAVSDTPVAVTETSSPPSTVSTPVAQEVVEPQEEEQEEEEIETPPSNPSANPTTTPNPSSNSGLAYFNDFSEASDTNRLDHFVHYRDPFVVNHTTGASDHAANGSIDCMAPETTRRQTRDNPLDHVYQCHPAGDPALGHMMAYAMDSSGYGFVGGLPDQVFEGTREVSVDVNTTSAGFRNFVEIKVLPASETYVNAMPCGPDLPCNEGWDYDDIGGVGASTVSNDGTGLTINTPARPDGYLFDQYNQATDSSGAVHHQSCDLSSSAFCFNARVHDGNKGIRDRFRHVFRDNGNGTLSFGIDSGTEMHWVTAPGSFPDGPVRVVIAFHNYTGTKDGNGPGFDGNVSPTNGGFTWHWDNLAVVADESTPSDEWFNGNSAARIVTPDGCIAFSQGQRGISHSSDVAPELLC